jgi:hypothetical protein
MMVEMRKSILPKLASFWLSQCSFLSNQKYVASSEVKYRVKQLQPMDLSFLWDEQCIFNHIETKNCTFPLSFWQNLRWEIAEMRKSCYVCFAKS